MTKIIRSYENKDTYTSRYKNLKRLVDSDGVSYIESAEIVSIEKSSGDKFHRVSPGEENRLDIISSLYYNTPLLYWAIAEANGINNPTQVSPGVVLRIPNISSIYRR